MGAKENASSVKAKRLSGPKTVAGKARSSLNALKHGFFSAELLIGDTDRPTYEKIRENLFRQLKPTTPTQHVAFESIIACAWRCVLALRLEGKKVTTLLAEPAASSSTDDKSVKLDNLRWFGSSRGDLRNAIRMLSQFEANLRGGGKLTDEEKQTMSRVFGFGFVDLLERWPDASTLETLKLAQTLDYKRRTFGFPVPNSDPAEDADRPQGADVPKDQEKEFSERDKEPFEQDIVDPLREQAMVFKLITQQRSFLQDLLRFSEQSWVSASISANNEFNPRYFASASKDLRRAFDWFLELRERDL